MRPRVTGLAFILLAGLALPPLAAAQGTDFFAVSKAGCAPERVTRCKAPGVECESKEATARDKTEVMLLDFEKKTATIRRQGQERPFGVILEDKIEGDRRIVTLGQGDGTDRSRSLSFALTRDGKMEGVRDGGRVTFEAKCAPVS